MKLSGPLLPRQRTTKRDERWRPVVLGFLTLLAVVLQLFLPLVTTYLSYVHLPLLFTIHFALSRRSPVGALLYGGAVGLLEDAIFNIPLGVNGIVKTLIGFFAASAGLRMDAGNRALRGLLSFIFYFIHQMFQFVITHALLGQLTPFDFTQTLIKAALNAAVSVPLFEVLDHL